MEPLVRTKQGRKRKQVEDRQRRPKQQPRYQVILWDDDEHTYRYVMDMMKALFGFSSSDAFRIAKTVDKSGRAICLTTTMEHAELKRDQIHAYGRDCEIPACQGSMTSTIEPVE